jgi:undecaprenyl-diphosphatase
MHGSLALLRNAAGLAARWVRRQEGIVLLVALAIGLTLFGFIKIAEEVTEGDTPDFDIWLLRLLRQPDHPEIPIGPSWLLDSARDITTLGGRTVLVMVVVAALGYLILEHKLGAMWFVLLAAAGGGGLSTTMKYYFLRDRPDVVPRLAVVTSPSFPSGHSVFAAVIYLTLGVLVARFTERRRTRIYLVFLALALTFLVGISRVYLGVHYPTDVLAGWCVGLAWALACWLMARYLQYRGSIERAIPIEPSAAAPPSELGRRS